MKQGKSGILLHISSLPGPYGIGEIGHHARDFIRTLKTMGQSSWQILPLGPTGYANSPYQALSSFAGNELLICFTDLIEQGLLDAETAQNALMANTGSVDFGRVITARRSVLDRVAESFEHNASYELKNNFQDFCEQHAIWLDDYALFTVLKNLHAQKPWHQWPQSLRDKKPSAIAQIKNRLQPDFRRVKLGQFLFFSQWQDLRATARKSGIELIGDVPIFIAHDSADAWCDRDLLLLDGNGECTVVAGVPPDYFSEIGQRWGNPLYNWKNHRKQEFNWWFRRLDHMLDMVDTVRIDHFRGFVAYWEIPADQPTAINGRWMKAPGRKLFENYRKHNPESQFIAEDLGVITKAVEKLRDDFNLPGMRVLQFAFDGAQQNIHLPANYNESCVAYTSTHDNDTLSGWLDSEQLHQTISKATGIPVDQVNCWNLIQLVMRSKAQRVLFPMQDVLHLDTNSRINTPSVSDGNWQWRLKPGQLDDNLEQQFFDLTENSGRI